MFAELLELGAQHGLVIPSHLPAPLSLPATTVPSSQVQIPSQNVAQPNVNTDVFGAVGVGTGFGLGINPTTALQHPGFYYLVAAECTEKRREALERWVKEEVSVSALCYLNISLNTGS